MPANPAAIRAPAVAGYFYPADPGLLAREVEVRLREAAVTDAKPPKAVIVPHAGHAYSGDTAAVAYARVAPFASRIRRVVMLGPAHRLWVSGMAVPRSRRWDTPLGPVAIDAAGVEALLALPFVEESDEPHAHEHCLEVQLPFLQRLLGDFTLLPVLVGGAGGAEVAQALERVWGGDETLVVISSDLSHYHAYDEARRLDARTCAVIERLQSGRLESEDACGARAVDGLLRCATRHRLLPETVGLCNSGDTTGDRDRVVGYGAWVFTASPASVDDEDDDAETEPALDDAARNALLDAAGLAVHAATADRPWHMPLMDALPAALRSDGASFVTLHVDGALRGCLGTLEPRRPLLIDVSANAFAACRQDLRFSPIRRADLDGLTLEISVLSALRPFDCADEAELLRRLRPGRDGLVLQDGTRRSTFLPKVWDTLPEPAEFVRQLRCKAGLPAEHWSASQRFWRYGSITVAGRLCEPA